MGMTMPMTPGHPSLKIKMIAIPIKANGKVIEAKNIGIFSSIMLKSLESMLTTFDISEFFIVNCDIEDSFAKRTDTSPALNLAPIIGA